MFFSYQVIHLPVGVMYMYDWLWILHVGVVEKVDFDTGGVQNLKIPEMVDNSFSAGALLPQVNEHILQKYRK